ncbi:MAG TPA: CPBP family intramembrane metalloprotease [Opitutales bacterium]|nr:CPBP family intramembrane metalloprotease [Opitutales bacterium]
MREFIPESWTDPNFLPAALTLVLAAAGIVALVALFLRRHRYSGMPLPGVTAWHLDWMEISALFILVYSWELLAGPISRKILVVPENPPAGLLAWQAVLDGALLQAGMIAVFLLFSISLPFLRRPAMSTVRLSWPRAIGLGTFYFLCFIPARLALELSWMGLLKWLSGLGLPVSMDEQDIAGVLGSAPPAAFAALIVLAGVVAPIVEETVFRAGLYRFLKGRFSMWGAVFFSSVIFSGMHINLLVFPTLLLFGISLCLVYEATGSIKVPIAMHAVFNLNSILLIALRGG